jgi:hypothetical protein
MVAMTHIANGEMEAVQKDGQGEEVLAGGLPGDAHGSSTECSDTGPDDGKDNAGWLPGRAELLAARGVFC